MKEMILKELHLENFQKFKNQTFQFGSVETHIHGENRAGKTTIQSAMLWLLFGKDANGSTDMGRGAFDIKRRSNGEVVHADVSVQGIFLLDGETITLKRVLHENYTKKNEYSGDETQCFVNYTPYQLGEYKKYIESIISEDEFRMITNIEYFLSLKTDFQRKYLCAMGGVQSVDDICSENPKWKEFLPKKTGFPLMWMGIILR
jgi:DNA repair exonuclease SbcCD ATPase subunit